MPTGMVGNQISYQLRRRPQPIDLERAQGEHGLRCLYKVALIDFNLYTTPGPLLESAVAFDKQSRAAGHHLGRLSDRQGCAYRKCNHPRWASASKQQKLPVLCAGSAEVKDSLLLDSVVSLQRPVLLAGEH